MDDHHRGRLDRSSAAELSRRRALRRLGGGGLAVGIVLGAGPRPIAAQITSTDATEAAARRAITAINQVLAGGDASGLDAAFAADYVDHTPHRSLQSGELFTPDLAGLEARLAELKLVFPDAALVVDDVIPDGDRAAVRFTFNGRLASTAPVTPEAQPEPAAPGGLPSFSAGGVVVVRVAGDKIAESWMYDEMAERYQMLVAAAAAAQATETATAQTTPTAGREGLVIESREVHDFQEVSLEGVGTLVIEQGDTESLTIEAEEQVLRKIATEVQGGRLTISPDRSFRTRESITYMLKVKQLTAIELSGAGRVEARQLTAAQLRLVVSGAGAGKLDGLTADVLDVAGSGNADLELAGAVDRQTISLAGASAYRAGNLTSRLTTITVEGASRATVRVSESLEARVSGAGSVEYIGDPTVSQDLSGAGRVTKVG